MITLKITDHKVLTQYSPAKVQFFRIDPEDLSATLENILRALMDLSWLSKFDQDYEKIAFNSRAQKTIADIKNKFEQCIDDSITKCWRVCRFRVSPRNPDYPIGLSGYPS